MRAFLHRKPFLPLFLTVFIDMLGIGIVIPILPIIFLTEGYLPGSAVWVKTALSGLLLACYPLAQFFGAPMLGVLSDKHGRKPILLLSLASSCIGYALFAFAVTTRSIPLLFLSRIIDGFTGGNISVARSAIADISAPHEKAKNFGLLGVAFGLGFVFGPFLGGKLTDSTLISWFTHATPFWFAALLVLLNISLVLLFLPETCRERVRKPISMLSGVRDVQRAFTHPVLCTVFISMTILFFGWSFFTQFFPVFLYDRFAIGPSQIGTFFAYVGIWIAIAQGIIIRPLSQKFGPRSSIIGAMLCLSLALLLQLIARDMRTLYLIQPLIAISFGFTMPNFMAILSNAVDAKSQGEIMGIQQSLISITQAIPAIIAGFSVAISPVMPVLLASSTIFIAWVVFTFWYRETAPIHLHR